MSAKRTFLIVSIAFIVVVVAGGALLAVYENLSIVDGLWLSVVTVLTIGYGDLVPRTGAGKIVSVILVVWGFTLFTYLMSVFVSVLLEGKLTNVWGKRKMERQISRLMNHVVVCGGGRVGKAVVEQLLHERAPFVVIEKDPERVRELQDMGALTVTGDATDEKVLLDAGILRARSVITALPEDAGNVFITITCKDLNPKLNVVARVHRPEGEQRLRRAGAHTVVSPAAIAGNRMALAALKPASVEFIQTLFDRSNISLAMEEINVSEGSFLAHKALKDSRLREDFSIQVLAIIRSGRLIHPPDPEEVFLPHDTLLVFGPMDKLSAIESL